MRARFILLPAFLALSLVAASTTAPLPPIPTSVYSRYGAVPVDMVKQVVCGDPTPPRVIGCYNSQERRIQIADTLELRIQTFVLYHEVCHLMMREGNVIFSDRQDEDNVCNAVGRYRLWEMESR
jgi:hypothetical protein